MHSPRKATTSRPSATSEHAREARARAWAYAFDCYRKKEATRPGSPDDGTKIKEDSANEHRST
jgi:hypothetical protein